MNIGIDVANDHYFSYFLQETKVQCIQDPKELTLFNFLVCFCGPGEKLSPSDSICLVCLSVLRRAFSLWISGMDSSRHNITKNEETLRFRKFCMAVGTRRTNFM